MLNAIQQPNAMTTSRSKRLLEYLNELRDTGSFPDATFDDISQRSICDDTVLHHAVRFFENDLVPELISLGIDINAEGDMKQTPLHVAVQVENFEMAELLIDHGASLTAIDELHAQPPFFNAMLRNNNKLLSLLFRKTLGQVETGGNPEIAQSWIQFHEEQKARIQQEDCEDNPK